MTIAGEARESLRQLFLDQGFARVGFTSAEPLEDGLSPWLAQGCQAGMTWLERNPAARADPRTLLPGATSVICVAAAYPAARADGHVAAYACGEDYHRTLRAALSRAVEGLPALLGTTPATRLCVDTSPLLERALAMRAGLGWIGRNSMLLNQHHGPWLMLGEVLTDLAITPDRPARDHCGECTACVQACPTGALLPDRRLDARSCISYWTIEHRGPLPEPVAANLGGWAFGCDECLSACPFPRREAPLPASGPFKPRPDLAGADLALLERRARESFRRHFGSTPLERARRGGLLRNLAALARNLDRPTD